jgi:hypothetical protein
VSVRSVPPAGSAPGRLATRLRSAALGLVAIGALAQGCALPHEALHPGASGELPPRVGSVDAPLNEARQRVPVVVRPPAGEDRTLLLAASLV